MFISFILKARAGSDVSRGINGTVTSLVIFLCVISGLRSCLSARIGKIYGSLGIMKNNRNYET